MGRVHGIMIADCKKLGMKPVCDHRNSYPGHRNNIGWFPSGWSEVKDMWNGMCNYAAKLQGGGNALCNVPSNTHSWQGAGYNPGFICGAVAKGCTDTQVANSNKAKSG